MRLNRRALCALSLPLLLSLAGAMPAPKQPKVGELAPEAEIVLVDGTKVKLSELRGEVVVLNFWATWCVPCRTELPTLDTYYLRQKQHGLRVFAVTTESSLPIFKLKPLFAKLAISPARKIKGPYAPIGDAVPSNFIIDRAGKLRYAKAGAFTFEILNEQLVPLLREPAPASLAAQ